jgi:hypothetical protein
MQNPRAAMLAAATREGRVREVAVEGPDGPVAPPRFPLPRPAPTATHTLAAVAQRSSSAHVVPLPVVFPQPVTPERGGTEAIEQRQVAPRRFTQQQLEEMQRNSLPIVLRAREVSARTVLASLDAIASAAMAEDDMELDAATTEEPIETLLLAPIERSLCPLERSWSPPPSLVRSTHRVSVRADLTSTNGTLTTSFVAAAPPAAPALRSSDTVRLHPAAALPRVRAWLEELRSSAFREKLRNHLSPTAQRALEALASPAASSDRVSEDPASSSAPPPTSMLQTIESGAEVDGDAECALSPNQLEMTLLFDDEEAVMWQPLAAGDEEDDVLESSPAAEMPMAVVPVLQPTADTSESQQATVAHASSASRARPTRSSSSGTWATTQDSTETATSSASVDPIRRLDFSPARCMSPPTLRLLRGANAPSSSPSSSPTSTTTATSPALDLVHAAAIVRSEDSDRLQLEALNMRERTRYRDAFLAHLKAVTAQMSSRAVGQQPQRQPLRHAAFETTYSGCGSDNESDTDAPTPLPFPRFAYEGGEDIWAMIQYQRAAERDAQRPALAPRAGAYTTR